MIPELLEYYCDQLDYSWTYGRMHWQNLNDFECDHQLPFIERKKHILLLYVDEDVYLNDYNAIKNINYKFEFILAVKSKLSDPDYQFKYENHIKNIKLEVDKLILNNISRCNDGLRILNYKKIEVENLLDTNLDGCKVSVNLSINPNYFEFDYSNNTILTIDGNPIIITNVLNV